MLDDRSSPAGPRPGLYSANCSGVNMTNNGDFRWQPNIKYISGYGCLKIHDKWDRVGTDLSSHFTIRTLYWLSSQDWGLSVKHINRLSATISYFSLVWHFYGSNISCINLCLTRILGGWDIKWKERTGHKLCCKTS